MSDAVTNDERLRRDAIDIWLAGVRAVTPEQLFKQKVAVEGKTLRIGECETNLSSVRRIVVVGAGKASAAMAIEFWRCVGGHLKDLAIVCEGWVNCPEGSFGSADDAGPITLFAARPHGLNEPTSAAVKGTRSILDLVAQSASDDLVICLLSGGGSALLVAPPEGVTLEDKQYVARLVAAAGGNIEQLNTIRRCLSEVKGGGLARACGANRLITVTISDVLGDPVEAIASGPTVCEQTQDAKCALSLLEQLGLVDHPKLQNVVGYLRLSATKDVGATNSRDHRCSDEYVILGNNADAVDAAGIAAVERGYRYVMQSARSAEGDVLEVARTAVEAAKQVVVQQRVDCWISGGEPTVTLPNNPGKGGRNQQLALAVLEQMSGEGWPDGKAFPRPLVFVSGGTDGEDGPTDAAGAFFDRSLAQKGEELELNRREYLQRANAYAYFERAGGLLKTEPTGTNVCDLRIALCERPSNE